MMTLKSKTLADAVAAANTFIDAVEALGGRNATEEDFRRFMRIGLGFKETDAVRRAFMILARALADVRRPA